MGVSTSWTRRLRDTRSAAIQREDFCIRVSQNTTVHGEVQTSAVTVESQSFSRFLDSSLARAASACRAVAKNVSCGTAIEPLRYSRLIDLGSRASTCFFIKRESSLP